jgi:hypothetical protein
MPSKGIRDHFIDALNEWLRVPQEKVQLIKHAIRILHNASLLYVNLESESKLVQRLEKFILSLGSMTSRTIRL